MISVYHAQDRNWLFLSGVVSWTNSWQKLRYRRLSRAKRMRQVLPHLPESRLYTHHSASLHHFLAWTRLNLEMGQDNYAYTSSMPWYSLVLQRLHLRPSWKICIQGLSKMRESPWIIILRMVYYFPVQEFSLVLFCLFHSVDLTHQLCEDGLYTNDQKAKVNGLMWYLDSKHFFASFWQSRLKVFEVTDNPDWKKRSFDFRIRLSLFSTK